MQPICGKVDNDRHSQQWTLSLLLQGRYLRLIWISVIAGLGTSLGALLARAIPHSQKMMSYWLGFAGGVMLSISGIALLPNALSHGSVLVVTCGFLFGGGLIWAADTFMPHAHVKDQQSIARVGLLIAGGIALHNLPEGLAVGAGYGDSAQSGAAIAAAIALHNIPEGMALALPMLAGGFSLLKVVGIATFAGLMTPIGAAIGSWFAGISVSMLAFSLAFAAGAMVYITSDELIPLSHQDGHSHYANAGVMIGFIVAALMG